MNVCASTGTSTKAPEGMTYEQAMASARAGTPVRLPRWADGTHVRADGGQLVLVYENGAKSLPWMPDVDLRFTDSDRTDWQTLDR